MTTRNRRGVSGWRPGACAVLGLLAMTVAAHESLQTSIDALTAAIAAAPARADAYLQRGELYRLHGDWAAAEADFRRAADIDGDAAQLDLLLGRLYFDAGRDDDARAALTRFVAAQPGHRAGWIALGRTLARQGEHAAAAAAFDNGITDRSAPELLLERSRALERAGRIDAALAGLDAAVARRGALIVLELEAIELELARGNTGGALRRIDLVADRMPRREGWLARRGAVLEQSGRSAEARAAYDEALAALDTLAAAQRATAAMRDLRREIVAALHRLSSQQPPHLSGR